MSETNGANAKATATIEPDRCTCSPGERDESCPLHSPGSMTQPDTTKVKKVERKKTKKRKAKNNPHAKLIANLERLHKDALKHADQIKSAIQELKKGA